MNQEAQDMAISRRHKVFSALRIWAIARNTFTQLVRMKVFYFMLIFSALIIGANLLFLSFTFEQELKILKDVSFGAMSLFASIFAIVGTALLIPKDIEDRTLYTILTKPVPRIEYLLGKLMGILLLLAVSILLMSLLFFTVLYIRQHGILTEKIASFPRQVSDAQIALFREDIFSRGLQPELLLGVLAVFLKAAVAAAVALFVSTFASSTLFTIIVSLVVYFIGHAQSLALDYYFAEGEIPSAAQRFFAGLIGVVFPNFQLFNVTDGLTAGEVVSASLMARLVGLTAFYLTIYSLVSWLIFAKKEL
ncbi:MAG: ABC transporter permease [Verrucomicrobiales bacterium]|nr:ABC transporter permease [Verrucomicrobiales bacterium]